MKKIFSLLFIASILLSACGTNGVDSTTELPTARAATKTPKVESTPETVSQLNVKEEALKGLEITVWTPWYGIESTLFESFVSEFNSSNPWGIKVSTQSQGNFSNLYETVTTSLSTAEET